MINYNVKFSVTHEWVGIEKNGEAVVGITDYAQRALGDIVYIELPTVGDKIAKGKECGVIESVKSASELYSPLSGEVIAINQAVIDDPTLLNNDPMGVGWLFKIRCSDLNELKELMDAEEYENISQ